MHTKESVPIKVQQSGHLSRTCTVKPPSYHLLTSQYGWGKFHKAQAIDEELQAMSGYGEIETSDFPREDPPDRLSK